MGAWSWAWAVWRARSERGREVERRMFATAAEVIRQGRYSKKDNKLEREEWKRRR